MSFHELGHDFVLASELGFELFDLAVLAVLGGLGLAAVVKGGVAVFMQNDSDHPSHYGFFVSEIRRLAFFGPYVLKHLDELVTQMDASKPGVVKRIDNTALQGDQRVLMGQSQR